MRSFLISIALLLNISVVAQDEQQWRDSLNMLNTQIGQNPQNTDLRLRKAAINIELGQWQYAIDEYGRVLDIDADNPAALYYRAYAHSMLRQYPLAQADYEKFLTIIPRHFEAQLGLAMMKKQSGKQQDTVDELNRLVQLFPDSTLAWAARAGFETEQQQYELALYDWDEALRRSPNNLDLIVSKADVLIRMKRSDEARQLLEQAIKNGADRAALRRWLDLL